MQNDFDMFIPFSKKDEDKHLVYGYASTEAVDSQGEIVEKAAIENALPDYMKFGNIREMHQPIAVGKAKSAKVDKKGLFLVSKIVDKDAWEKVKEGVYNGYSIGGRKLMTVGNKIKKLLLAEISIVDRPANPEAVFSLVKFNKDGVAEGPVEVKPETKEEKKKREEMIDMFDAAYILSMAKELAYLYMSYKQAGKPTKNIEAAIVNLKACAKENLGKDGVSIIEDMMKAKLSSGQRKDMPKGEFAYIDSKGGKHLPIQDEAHVRNAIARFGQTSFESPAKKKTAAGKILAAARKFGIKVSSGSEVAQAAGQKAEKMEVWQDNWEQDYFAQMQKVLG